MSQSQSDHEKQYTRLITLLKRRCGKARPSVAILEWAMDKLKLPDNFEVDYDKLVVDLSCFELDAEQEQIRLVERRYKKMANEAKQLTGTEPTGTEMIHNSHDECLKAENEALIARVEQLLT